MKDILENCHAKRVVERSTFLLDDTVVRNNGSVEMSTGGITTANFHMVLVTE